MFTMPKYRERVSLIPYGCPQLLDLETPLERLRIRRYFEERKIQEGDELRTVLHSFQERDGELYSIMEGSPAHGDGYELDGRKILQPWLGKWIPLPFLREREQFWDDGETRRVECGPSNWARVRLALSDDKPDTLRIVLAFDMQVEEREPNLPYAALSTQDVNAHAQFRLAWHIRDNAWFLKESWVDEWLRDIWSKRKVKGRDEDDVHEMEHFAAYLTLLEMLDICLTPDDDRPRDGKTEQKKKEALRVYVINPAQHMPVNVDLVLDIGNSRTTGILVETRVQSATNLNSSYLLQLRDMDQPQHVYTDPFETRIEFSEISFGNDALSRRSGRRTPAFAWPSPVRIGPEAARLSTLSTCAEGSTGLSSPKRYLWNEHDYLQSWRFNTQGKGEPYVTRGPLMARINSSGTPLYYIETGHRSVTRHPILKKQDDCAAFESLFTPSSLMMFLLVEVLQQALLTINSPGQRERRDMSDVPRRLRQVIFTVPPGMPIAEQRIYRRWAIWAVHTLWEALGWDTYYKEKPVSPTLNSKLDFRTNPSVRCNWDEATCTQLVYIYNEISNKYQGDAQLLCTMMGRPRPEYGGHPCLRVATIDIGGGTTDLSVTTFELQNDAGSTARMAPHPEFHDGFNIAGDDVLCAVIREQVFPALIDAAKAAGASDAANIFKQLFGRDIMDSAQESRNLRAQFIRQVAVPAALCLLAAYEKTNLGTGTGLMIRPLRDCFHMTPSDSLPDARNGGNSLDESGEGGSGSTEELPFSPHPAPSAAALSYVEKAICQSLGDPYGFSLLDAPLRMDTHALDGTIRSTLKEVLANLCEVIHVYDCDVLLLTGRPSRWQGIVSSIFANLPVPPDRILPMGNYHVGAWYPFADVHGNMTDPKTTVVVGAILCALAEGRLEGFSFNPSQLSVPSTARYIGEMEINGQIKKAKVWYEVDIKDTRAREYVKEIAFSGPISVGFRQLDLERWSTTRFYAIDFASEEFQQKYKNVTPLRVKLILTIKEVEDDTPADMEHSERDEGEFYIDEITDCNGDAVNLKALDIRLQTLPRDEGFWLDTGIIYA